MTNIRTERRRHFDPTPRAEFAPVTDHCKWVMPNGQAHADCVAKGWALLIDEPNGMLFQELPSSDRAQAVQS